MTMQTNAHKPLNELHTAAGETSASGATQPQEVQQDVDTRSCAVLASAETYLNGNPWKSSGAAASSGVLVGLLLARR